VSVPVAVQKTPSKVVVMIPVLHELDDELNGDLDGDVDGDLDGDVTVVVWVGSTIVE
jgi:hypothetical protein